MLTVHVRISDATTGKPVPVRVRFVDAQGVYHAPLGRLAAFAVEPGQDVGGHLLWGGQPWAYVDGACEVNLPPGPVTVELCKGPEYTPLRREVTLKPGQISLRLAIDRWADPRAEGWYAGDTRAIDLPPHAALLEGAAEGLAVVNLLARERPPEADRPAALTNLLAFSGTAPALVTPACLVAVNTLNHHPVLGTVALLDSHRPVYPLRFGGPDRPDDWSVADWCDQCHRKRGLVVWSDLPRLTAETPQGEALAALVLGKVDAFEVARFPDPEPAVLADYYRLLDAGLLVPLVGGSGKDSNAVPLGVVRTYARLEAGTEFGYARWVEAVRAGRTFATNGPLLSFEVDGQGPGAVLDGPAGRTVRVRARAEGTAPFDVLEVLVNGSVAVAKEASGNRQAVLVEAELEVSAGAWVAARCWGRDRLPGGQCVYAHSSPVYLRVAGAGPEPHPEAVSALVEVFDQTLAWVREQAHCPTPREREHLEEVLRSARAELVRRSDAHRGGA